MFDKLLKSKFYTKSKSATKLTRIRIATIKRKRNAMQKYLKNDIADLLKNGLDVNAYGRVEGLWNELNLSSCYDFVEQFCIHISSHLTNMDKQRECPDECREAASSLMFAAARFADLPELRDLRNVFLERYGSSIEHYANKEFINKLKSMPPAKDMKLQLVQDIAAQSSVEWNVKNLEQKLFNPPAFGNGCTKSSNGNQRVTPEMIDVVQSIDNEDAEYKHDDPKKYTSRATEMGYISCDGELSNDESTLPIRKNVDGGLNRTRQEGMAPSDDNQEEKAETKEQRSEPPHPRNGSGEEEEDMKPFYYKTIRRPSYRSKISSTNNVLASSANSTDSERSECKDTNATVVKEDDLRQHDRFTEAKSEPKSVRTRNRKPPPGQDNIDSSEPKNLHSNGMNQDLGNQGKQCRKELTNESHDRCDAEEKAMDRLLLHYSSKMQARKTESVIGSLPQLAASKRGVRDKEDNVKDGPAHRTASLPAESSAVEATKAAARACSFRPEMLNPKGQVHSKPPDYDDFVARLAAFRRNL